MDPYAVVKYLEVKETMKMCLLCFLDAQTVNRHAPVACRSMYEWLIERMKLCDLHAVFTESLYVFRFQGPINYPKLVKT